MGKYVFWASLTQEVHCVETCTYSTIEGDESLEENVASCMTQIRQFLQTGEVPEEEVDVIRIRRVSVNYVIIYLVL